MSIQSNCCEGQDSQARREHARSILYRLHRERVEGIADEIIGAIAEGEISDEDGLTERLDSECDSAVTYTSDAVDILYSSENDDAADDAMGEGEATKPEQRAYFALQADVRQLWANEYHLADLSDDVKAKLGEEFDMDDVETWPANRAEAEAS